MEREKETSVVAAEATLENKENNISEAQKDTLVVYYSRTGTTKIIAEKIAKFLGADIGEITGEEDLSGLWGALKLSYRVLSKSRTQLKNPPEIKRCYKNIWIGGPVHASSLASPLFTWIDDNKKSLNQEGRQIFLFGTEGRTGHDGMFAQTEKLIGVKALRKLIVTRNDIESFDPEKSPEIRGVDKVIGEKKDEKEENENENEHDEKEEVK